MAAPTGQVAALESAILKTRADQRAYEHQRGEAIEQERRALAMVDAARALQSRCDRQIEEHAERHQQLAGRARRADPRAARAGRVTWLRRNVHLVLAIGWVVMMPVSALTPIRNSVPFLVGVSVYALAVSHFSAWRASRAERAADS